MVTGLELFGLVGPITATVSIITSIVEAVKAAQTQGTDERDLQLRFEADSAALRLLLVAIENSEAVDSQTLSAESESLSSDVTAHLESIRFQLESLVAKIRPQGSDASSPTAATSNPTIKERVTWVLWRRRDLEKLEASLFHWIQRVEVVLSAIRGRSFNITSRAAWTAAALSSQDSVDRIIMKINDYSRLATRAVDEEVLFKPMSTINFLGGRSRRSPAQYRPAAGSESDTQPVVIEYTAQAYNQNNPDAIEHVRKATHDLAMMLFNGDPDRTGLLQCMGYTHDERRRSFALLYELPPGVRSSLPAAPSDATVSTPPWRIQTLRDLYQHHPVFSLTNRLKLCCDLAKAILYVHLLGWVHKSVRPDNIVFFMPPAGSESDSGPASAAAAPAPQAVVAGGGRTRDRPPGEARPRAVQTELPQCYLAGFEYARSAQAASDRRSDGDWQHNVYRHPRRQGIAGNSEYTMAHDIYSLGVVCLEIGMWGQDRDCPVPYGGRSRFKALSADGVKAELFRILEGRPASESRSGTATGGLATFMGDKFAAVVRYCLEVGERDDIPGPRYIRDVWLKLDDIRCAL